MDVKKAVKHVGAGVVLMAVPVLSFAQTAQPDTADATTYIAAGIPTFLAIYNAKYIWGGVTFVARKVMAAFGR